MDIKRINADLSVSDQIHSNELESLAAHGVKSIICNRPDNEGENQQQFRELEEKSRELGLEIHYLPVIFDHINAADVEKFETAWETTPKPVHAFCRTGLRAITLWSLMRIRQGNNVDETIAAATDAGFDFSKFKTRFAGIIKEDTDRHRTSANKVGVYDVVIVGAGAAGISVASSLLERDYQIQIAIIDPADKHYYQPGFTMVGRGIFTPEKTVRSMQQLIPREVSWIKEAVAGFEPDNNHVILDNGSIVGYERLVVCPGLKLDWDGVEGLQDALGKNGVTSNYHPQTAAYTWELVQSLKQGRALFTQPPMPIKCAGAPQKALYLSADYWLKRGVLDNIQIQFYNAGNVLFGVKEYVPALQRYIDKYHAELMFQHNLKKVDADNKTATFIRTDADGNREEVITDYDMIHVCPPQTAPDFIRNSPLADEAGWVEVDKFNLRHKRFANIWSLGDACNTPNAKTAAAVRKQAPVVAANIILDRQGDAGQYAYDGYGSCPLTVEKGKIVLAEFAYDGKLSPTFPRWMLNGTQATRKAWILKKSILPKLYWDGMLKGHEWLVSPKKQRDPVS